MPRFPAASPESERVRPSPFAAFAQKLGRLVADPDFVPLHLGDTHPLPPLPARSVNLDDPALHRYGPTGGGLALRDAGAEDLRGLGLAWATRETTFVTPGATGALDLAMNSVLSQGDEVLVLTPTWPVIWGLLSRRGAVPVQVPVSDSGALPEPAQLVARLEAACGPATAAISFCNPNNPAGFVYSAAHLDALAAFAESRGLWVFCDAVYTDLCMDPSAQPLADLPARLAPRAFVTTSYSKSFGLAGHRVGLLCAPPERAPSIPRLQTHTTYHPSNLSQAMAAACLAQDPAAGRAIRQDLARRGAALTVERCAGRVPLSAPPAGGAFVFLDLREWIADGDALLAFLERALDAGVSLAPGAPFGDAYPRFARLCFTSVPRERLAVGLDRVLGLLAR